MRFQFGFVGALLLASACGGDGTSPAIQGAKNGEGTEHSITGQVLTAGPGPDSSYVGVPGAEVVLVSVPLVDGGGPDSSLIDPMTPGVVRPHATFASRMDSSWIDTIPSDTSGRPPVDTSVTNPYSCGSGSQVATTTTDASGHFSFEGLDATEFDVVVNPPSGFWGNQYCRADLRSRQTLDIQMYLQPRHDSTAHGLD